MNVSGLFVVLAIVLVWNDSVAANSNSNVRRCCPPGYAFVVLDDAVEESGHLFPHPFRCRERSNVAEEEPDDGSRLFGYNLDVTNETIGIPQCSTLVMAKLDNVSDMVSTEMCIDDLPNGQRIVLRCSGDRMTIDLHRVLKCCPERSSYDLTERSCVFNDQSLDVFNHLAGQNIVVFEVRTPECLDNEEVFIEYLSETHHLRLHQSSLDVVSVKHQLSEHLAPLSYCIEGVTKEEVSPTEADSFFSEPPPHPLIVRTCRPRSVCNRMPCVRRCCRNEQMLEEHDGESICVQHERNIRPTFYDLMYPLAADKQQTVADPPGIFKILGLLKKKMEAIIIKRYG